MKLAYSKKPRLPLGLEKRMSNINSFNTTANRHSSAAENTSTVNTTHKIFNKFPSHKPPLEAKSQQKYANIMDYRLNSKALNNKENKPVSIKYSPSGTKTSQMNQTAKTFKSKGLIETEAYLSKLKPKNINCYRHLLDPGTNTNVGSIDWTFRLREGITFNYYNKKQKEEARQGDITEKAQKVTGIPLTVNVHPPSFYEEDLEKFKKRQRSRPFTAECNRNFLNIRHLSKRTGISSSCNSSEYIFATTLREDGINKLRPGRAEIKSAKVKGTRVFTADKKWNFLPNEKLSEYLTKFEKPANKTSIENYRKIDKYLYKPLIAKYEEITVGKDTIKRKRLLPDLSAFYSGIEKGSDHKYSDMFYDVNTFPNKNILRIEPTETCLFELNLRANGPIQRKYTRRIKKEVMEKVLEETIRKKRDDFLRMRKLSGKPK